MAVRHRDPVTGRMTTGHDWNGIEELETPIPRIVFFFLTAAFLFALLWWILMPAWPLVTTHTKGILGIDQQQRVERQVAEARHERSAWTDPIMSMSWAEIEADEALMKHVRETGHRLFGDNCAACHGADAKGGFGYPDLTDGDWLWGGGPDRIARTLTVGVNSAHPESRVSQMPAFGRDEILSRKEIVDVARYVLSLSDPSISTPENLGRIKAGRQVFLDNCAACHGEDATGDPKAGIPNLSDSYWLYGGDLETIIRTVHGGRSGHMPTWQQRLSPVEIRILALYVDGLRRQAE